MEIGKLLAAAVFRHKGGANVLNDQGGGKGRSRICNFQAIPKIGRIISTVEGLGRSDWRSTHGCTHQTDRHKCRSSGRFHYLVARAEHRQSDAEREYCERAKYALVRTIRA